LTVCLSGVLLTTLAHMWGASKETITRWWPSTDPAPSTSLLVPNDPQSATITFDTGVAQGSALSPLLFLIFINALLAYHILGLTTDRGQNKLQRSHGLKRGVQLRKREVNRATEHEESCPPLVWQRRRKLQSTSNCTNWYKVYRPAAECCVTPNLCCSSVMNAAPARFIHFIHREVSSFIHLCRFLLCNRYCSNKHAHTSASGKCFVATFQVGTNFLTCLHVSST
jgi:hypothetical protein